MARYTGPIAKQSRRERTVLHANLKSARALEKRPYPPGEHGRGRIKESEYLLQLREKQKARRIYGVLERQFRNYYDRASRSQGLTGENLLVALEMRLDNVVFRGGLARTRREARQLVNHKHFKVNGRTVNIPSYEVRVGDVITLRERSRNIVPVIGALELLGTRNQPGWVSLDQDKRQISVLSQPERKQIDVPVQEQLIVELYSK
ncbi:SSU ribosomal protein S4p (S9e) [Euzebya pacifica]|jgi:small subunit ribosomal protein S4|uniref:Small ribosomal subunit protein uS4 n=1 Tax=Euzebya pacifica TaxID=1608957 RepID=A0A346Y3S7_9ACTN|nr:30S ribosomal protein S4 [Euzebya pacifica]AXV09124.1 SSU ribosomal protein S4p (S9e) [Euzebya pacifica]